MASSNVSTHLSVRQKMVDMQREIAKSMSCVLDGRDIGSVVLPNAKYKFFITANSEVRAQRRFDELTARGETVDFERLHEEIKARDKQDMERTFAPLICADDAMIIDTSNMDIEEVVASIKKTIHSKI
jgi:cytidylate kinase